MGKAINLLRNYPKSKRNLKKRAQIKSQKIRSIARKFGKHFFGEFNIFKPSILLTLFL